MSTVLPALKGRSGPRPPAPRAAGAGLVAGVLLALSLPPWGWWPLALAGAAVLVCAWKGLSLPCQLLCGMVAGLAYHGLGLWWMVDFSIPGYVAATLVEAGILAAALLAVPAGRGRLVAFPAALVLAQAVQNVWPFGGVPVDGIAIGQAGGLLAPAARVGGQLLVVALVGAAGSGLCCVMAAGTRVLRTTPAAAGGGPSPAGAPKKAAPRRRPSLFSGVALLGAVVLVAVAGAVAPTGSPAGQLSVAAVQGGGVRGVRAINSVPAEVFEAQLRASTGVRPPVDLVLWPEDVIDVDALPGSTAELAVAGLARALGATVVVGVVEDAPRNRFRNAAVAFGPDGSQVDRYDKVHRVPFGEYVPGRELVRRVADIAAVPRDAIAGRGPGVLQTPAGRLGVTISYEVFFADRARAAVRAGGTLLLVPTNASSYTTSQVPGQELAAARLRAIETGRTVVQAAPTGYSAVVDPAGRVRARSRLGEPAVIQREVTLRTGQTIATRLGDWPTVAGSILVILTASVSRWSSKNRRGSSVVEPQV